MAAENDLASVRSSLLIVAQTGDASGLAVPRRNLARLRSAAKANEMPAIEALCSECQDSIKPFGATDKISPGAVYAVLDIVARIEAAVWDVPVHSEDFLSDIAGFIEASFDDLMPNSGDARDPEPVIEEFEIDEETLDIFRSEADELLSNIAENLGILSAAPADQNALWEVRRNAHTFKGAAGIVGLKEASEVAHRMEDLLDKMVEMRCEAAPPVISFLIASSRQLTAITAAKELEDTDDIEQKYMEAITWLSLSAGVDETKHPSAGRNEARTSLAKTDAIRSTTTPIVRVSLDRLDELIKLSNSLIVNRSVLAERLAEIGVIEQQSGRTIAKFESLFEAQKSLTDEIHAKLLKIRMVKFGTLETRLSRNVHSTCVDEGKKAVLEIGGGEVEIDTQMIDALIEPLLHLLKNAVVHGIEPPEIRRLIGKPERGQIVVKIEADDEALVMSVSDDGAGISAIKLREKAVSSGIITEHQAGSFSDNDAMRLIFDRGLTTAVKVDLNAGRGVGMSIVKEAIESRGGRIQVTSEPQRGTTFIVLMPIRAAKHESPATNVAGSEKEFAGSTPLVLIVDDSPSIRRQSTKLVEQAGLRVITANNGADALELLLNGEWEPDLILSDVEMPQIDGWGFLEYVKTDANFGHIPVVMVTSLDAEIYSVRALELGASDYLTKPLNETDLARVVETLVNNSANEPAACSA